MDGLPFRTGQLGDAHSMSGNRNAPTVDNLTSDDTFDFFDNLESSTYSAKATTLPQLPCSPLQTAPSWSKKRYCDIMASSSDTPLFSSDDLLASTSDNYLDVHRHKRLHRRNWYQDEVMTPQNATSGSGHTRLRGPFSRKYDSGVWLNSDESTESEQDRTDAVRKTLRVLGEGGRIDWKDGYTDLGDDTSSGVSNPDEDESMALYHKALLTMEDPGSFEGPVFPYWGKQPCPDQLQRFHTSQKHALNRVMECVESGKEAVDLS